MNEARFPSLELSWLPLSDRKSLPTPRLIYADLNWCGGFFCIRGNSGLESTLPGLGDGVQERDIIVLSTAFGEPSKSTIAHEHRHFQQSRFLDLPQLPKTHPGDIDFSDWDEGLRQFYARPWEFDALRYQRRADPKCEKTEREWIAARGWAP